MLKLYEIMQQYEDIATFDMDTDDDVSAFMELLKNLEGTFDDKAEAYCRVIRNYEGEADAFKAEKARLEKRQKALQNRAAAMKDYLQFEAGKIIAIGDKRKVGLFTLAMRQNAEKLILDDEILIPSKYKQTVKVIQNDKVKEALQAGKTITGAHLERGISLRIS